MKGKALVALSGGVDSSVSAALLQRDGYQVEGAFIKTWSAPWLPCTWREERRDAMRVAAQLHIPFHTVDLEKEYEEYVVQYLVREYAQGRTPNPDVMCNREIKFGGFFSYAQRAGFDYIATGHYARVTKDVAGTYSLHAGKDAAKDQSYFLWTLTQEHLAHTLFPIGAYEKKEVRRLAAEFALSTAQKKDSQGICFLGKVDLKEFLSQYIQAEEGAVLDVYGELIGYHDGALFLTVGQRRGFTVTKKGPDTKPYYIVAKDVIKNTITVAHEDELLAGGYKMHEPISVVDVHWIEGVPSATCTARIRYRQALFPVSVVMTAKRTASITPLSTQPFFPSGQSIVFYDTDRCLGGGVLV